MICISGSLPEKLPSKNLPKKFFIASKDAPSKIKANSIGGPGPYLAPGAFLNENGKKLPKNDATVNIEINSVHKRKIVHGL